jgi:hypothetical protein
MGMVRVPVLVSVLVSVLGADRARAQPAPAQEQEQEEVRPGAFDAGRFGVAGGVGSEDAFEHTYLRVGLSLGYYVAPGLEVSMLGEHWFGDDPSVSLASPRVRYVFWMVPWSFKPYVGTGTTHWFVGDPFEDVDAVAGRAGVIGLVGGSLVLGLGAVVERIVSECEGDDCWSVYPELTFGIAL